MFGDINSTLRRILGRQRELNLFGKPGKLHAKAAVIDKQALLSSANLKDDAFLRNLELGVLFMGGDMPTKLREHFEHLTRGRPPFALESLKLSQLDLALLRPKHRFKSVQGR